MISRDVWGAVLMATRREVAAEVVLPPAPVSA